MVTLANPRQLYGDVVETATLVHSLLAPVASQLSEDPSGLHRRCVFGQLLGFFRQPDDVRDDLAPFGAIEAVAVCEILHNAVIIFRAEASVAFALRRQAETSAGWFTAVPPLAAALPLRCMPQELVKLALYPPTPAATATGAASTHAPPRPLRPLFCSRNSPEEEPMIPLRGAAGTTRFMPWNSRVYGPTLGADGHLWMDGHNVLYYENGVRVDPTWIRVARLDPPGKYGSGPPTFVPLFSV